MVEEQGERGERERSHPCCVQSSYTNLRRVTFSNLDPKKTLVLMNSVGWQLSLSCLRLFHPGHLINVELHVI
jgi:hypothetical protein